MELNATLTTAGVAGLILLLLSYRVTERRIGQRLSLGHGEDETMLVRMRTQANFVEYVPLALILMALLETRGPSPWLWVAGAVLILARLAHARGMAMPAPNMFRAGGTLVTWGLLAVLSIAAIAAGL